MIPTRVLLNGIKNTKPKLTYPVELTPLFAAVGVAICSGAFFTYRHFAYDKELRVWKTQTCLNWMMFWTKLLKKVNIK